MVLDVELRLFRDSGYTEGHDPGLDVETELGGLALRNKDGLDHVQRILSAVRHDIIDDRETAPKLMGYGTVLDRGFRLICLNAHALRRGALGYAEREVEERIACGLELRTGLFIILADLFEVFGHDPDGTFTVVLDRLRIVIGQRMIEAYGLAAYRAYGRDTLGMDAEDPRFVTQSEITDRSKFRRDGPHGPRGPIDLIEMLGIEAGSFPVDIVFIHRDRFIKFLDTLFYDRMKQIFGLVTPINTISIRA